MSMNFLVADVLTRIRNAKHVGHTETDVPSSNFVKNVLAVLEREGYIGGVEEYEVRPGIKNLKVKLKYFQGKPVINELIMVSKPGCRRYSNIKSLPKVRGGLGISILSTSLGVLSDGEARRKKVGGEVICNVF
ncbi:MAG: 30S ribosomal protein S8 [Proteobacteria bacterium]|nr:30S ribosomal protein S8 [Pseudomonadota bacterium]